MHELNRCVVTGWKIEKKDRAPLQQCQHCGTPLPMQGDTTPVEDDATDSQKIFTVTTEQIEGYRIVKTLGLVRASYGHNVRVEATAAKNLGELGISPLPDYHQSLPAAVEPLSRG